MQRPAGTARWAGRSPCWGRGSGRRRGGRGLWVLAPSRGQAPGQTWPPSPHLCICVTCEQECSPHVCPPPLGHPAFKAPLPLLALPPTAGQVPQGAVHDAGCNLCCACLLARSQFPPAPHTPPGLTSSAQCSWPVYGSSPRAQPQFPCLRPFGPWRSLAAGGSGEQEEAVGPPGIAVPPRPTRGPPKPGRVLTPVCQPRGRGRGPRRPRVTRALWPLGQP